MGHGATGTAGRPQNLIRAGGGSHVGATAKGGVPVAHQANAFRFPAMSNAQIGVIRQNLPTREKTLGVKGIGRQGGAVRYYTTGTPKI